MLWSPSSPSTNTVTATNIIINTTILQYPTPCEAMVSLDCVHPEVTQCGRRGFKVWALTEVQSPGEIKRREVELDSHSLMDCLAAELFLISCFERCLCDFVLHSCWNSNRHAFVGGYSEQVGKMTDTHKQKAEKANTHCRSDTDCLRGMCRSDSRLPQLVV